MKTFRNASFFILAVVFGSSVTSPCCAQTAEEIVNKDLDAMGGKTFLSGLKSVVIESSIDVNGNEASSTTYILNGKGFKSVTNFNGSDIIQCQTDKSGWTLIPPMGQTTATAMPENAVKLGQGQLYIGGPLMAYSDNGGKIELTGKDTADYKVHLTNSVGTDATFYINMKTYLLDMIVSKMSQGGQDFEMKITFSDYRKTDGGPMVAFTQVRELPQYTLNIAIKKVDVNKEIDPAIFDMPK